MAEAPHETLARWRRDPVAFVREVFAAEPDLWQREFLEAFGDPAKQRIAAQACAGPGKTAVLAWCGWLFLLTYASKGKHPNGAAMSITADNLKSNLWKELSVWYQKSDLLKSQFEVQATRIFQRQHKDTWFLDARSFAKSANADEQGRTLSGLHAPYILYLIDESGDIPPSVGRAAEQGLGNCEWGKILQAGNPTSQTGLLYESVGPQSKHWTVVRITGDPNDPRRSPRINLAQAQSWIDRYGRDNPWVMSYVLGLFPPTAVMALLTPDEVRTAMQRKLALEDYEFSQRRIGVDVARFGDDATVFYQRQGKLLLPAVEMRGARTNEIAAKLLDLAAKWSSEMEMIDDTGGWGAGVIDQVRLAGRGIVPVNFSAKPIDGRYLNKRAEMWFLMAEWVKGGGALPQGDEALVAELTTPTYFFRNGKFALEEKDDIKARIGRSPDYADALALTFALPEMPSHVYSGMLQGTAHATTEYDPFDASRY